MADTAGSSSTGPKKNPFEAGNHQASARPATLRAAATPLVVERSFAWLIKNRRLVRDFEQRTDVAKTLIRIAAISTMLRRIE